VNRMRAAFKRRRQVMDEAIRANGLTVAGQGGFGGSSFWMQAADGIDTEALAARLREEGVLIEPGRAFFAPERASNRFYRLAYSSIPQTRISDGVGLIAQALRNWT
jgi:GntR family transcriptional regulator / MocR family aminotransferase